MNRLCIPLQTPAIHARPRMRKIKTSVSAIRRSLRLAAKPREADSTKQAQSILMKKLGTVVNSPAADSELIRKFRTTFSETLSASKHEAVYILFGGDFIPATLGLDAVGLDDAAL